MEGGGSAALQLARDLMPSAPKRWPLLLALAAAYYAGKEVLPFLWQKSLKGDVAVITGGAGGIGRLMALRLAREGCKVVLLDINKAGLDAVAAEVAALGVTARAYVCDVSKREDIYRVCKQVEDDFGRVDILINNAGIVGGKTLLEADDNRMELTIRINTMALMWMTKALLPGMLRRNHGHVINVASSAGLVGLPGLVDYCASKFGAVGFDESLRIELKKLGTNVKTTCLCKWPCLFASRRVASRRKETSD
jgi:all-trans-retinol dehydrogenase (NAD+)